MPKMVGRDPSIKKLNFKILSSNVQGIQMFNTTIITLEASLFLFKISSCVEQPSSIQILRAWLKFS